jgi:hypothetical protein
MATASDPILATLARALELSRFCKAIAVWTSVVSLVLLAVVIKFVFWPQAYIAPAGGPGLVEEGTSDDGTIQDYAERWYRERWNWRIDTHKRMQDRVLAFTHPKSRGAVKGELEKEARLVRDYQISAQTEVLESKIVRRKGEVVTVAVQASRTLYFGGKADPDSLVEAKLLVLPWVRNGRPSGLVAIPGATTPALMATP